MIAVQSKHILQRKDHGIGSGGGKHLHHGYSGDRLTRAKLIEKLSLAFPQFSLKDVDMSVHVVLDKVSQTLANGDRVEIRGFGSFALNLRPQRVGRNPKTGVSVHILAKYVPHFKVGKELRERVNSQ